ncbi:MAG: pyridoxal-phosphate dependent enzyme, partial [Streptosporangiaceae bacterium]
GEGPWGSIKDRTALSLLRSVASRIEVPGTTLVESTSGNLGVALASAAVEIGLRFVAVTDPNMSPVLEERLTALGAELMRVTEPDRQGGYLDARLKLVGELTAADPSVVWTDQYHNPANPLAHYQGTGPELDRQTYGVFDAVFVAVSTGGTLAGLGRYLHHRRPDVRVIAVDVPGSRVFAEPTGSRLLTGIGASQASCFLRPGDWDEVVIVDDVAAIAHCHALADALGVRLGGSGGAVLAACAHYLALHPEIRFPVCLCPDSGDNYTRTLYAPGWLSGRGVQLSRELLQPTADHPPVAFLPAAWT